MREILFKAIRKDNKQWIEGNLIHQLDFYGQKVERCFMTEKNDTYDYDIGEVVEVQPETVGQFVGSPDKNNKNIFEGDKVQWSVNGSVVVGDVFFAYCWFDLRDGSGCIGWDPIRGISEIIGNIHDQKEDV